jgi:hypothetical protein
MRGPKGDLGLAPIAFVAELTLHTLEPAQKPWCHNLIDVIGAGAQIPWRGSEERRQHICMLREVRTEVRRSRFGSPQK